MVRQNLQFLLVFGATMKYTRLVTDSDNDDNDDNDYNDDNDDHKVGHCPHPVVYGPWYWWTRYPPEISKFWNLTNLLHPEAWMWTFLSFILITVTLKLASVLGTKMGLNIGSDEVALIPFRLFFN